MPAAVQQSVYAEVLEWIACQSTDKPIYISEIPEKLRDTAALARAWDKGLVEFGRANHLETSRPIHEGSSRAGDKIVLFETGVSWSGARRVIHKSLADTLKEDAELPAKVIKRVKIQDPVTKDFRIEETTLPGNLLRLQVRITDKGWAHLRDE